MQKLLMAVPVSALLVAGCGSEASGPPLNPVADVSQLMSAVANGAMTLIEGANLLMIGDRARDQEGWMEHSQRMSEAGLLMHEAAMARDADRVFELGETVYRSCDSCHSLYWVGDADKGR